MIATKILIVKCDGCNKEEIMEAEPFLGEDMVEGEAICPMQQEGWMFRWRGNMYCHFCPACKEKHK